MSNRPTFKQILSLTGTIGVFAFGAALISQTRSISYGQVIADTAEYQIVFDSTWSPETHPFGGFPSNEHYSPLIGATHSEEVFFWEVGGLATSGIESMAETGSVSAFENEIDEAIDANAAEQIINGPGMTSSPSSVSINSVEVSIDFPLLTLVTMIAPSPDWFVGVSGLPLLDENGDWVNELEVMLFPYDAGTEEGDGYSTNNPATNPIEPIARIAGQSPFSSEPLGTFRIVRLDQPTPTPTTEPTNSPTLTLTPTASPSATPEPTATLAPTQAPQETPVPDPTVEVTPEPSVTLDPDPTETEIPNMTPTVAPPFQATNFTFLPQIWNSAIE